MSGSVETIKDFLLSLGFAVDESGYKKFGGVLTDVTRNALKLGATVEGAALAVVGFSAHIASGLDKIYWAAERTGASAQAIKSLGYAMAQAGGSAAGAQSALDSMARFLRNQPGAEGWLNHLGVSTRDAQGHLLKTETLLTGVSQRLSQMPFYRANQYAQMLGIDENTLLALRRGIGHYAAEYQMAAQKIGFNAEAAAKQSNVFMTALHSFGMIAGQVKDKIGANLAGGLAGELDTLKKRLLDNFPKIEKTLTTTLKGILALAGALTRLLYRGMQGVGQIIDWWEHLDSSNKKLIAGFGALLVAWRLLNSAFLLSPIGIILSLTAAIGLLYDDYMTWKDGGKSLINWSTWGPEIEQAKKAFSWIGDKISGLVKSVGGWKNTLEMLATFIAGVWVSRVLDAFGKITGLPIPPWLKLWGLYAGYLVSDRENIVNSANSSWDYNIRQIKRGVGDGLKTWGIDNPWASKNHGDASADPLALPRGIRNNNPGNINYVGQAGAEREYPSGRFARFKTAFDGLKALSYQLMLYAGRGINSIEKIISTWAPGNENNTEAYISAISKKMGIPANAALNLRNPQIMSSLMSGIIQHENGRNPYESELINRAALAGMGAKLHQETNIHINGATDPIATGMDIARRQTGVNATLVQQVNTRVR